MRLLVWICIQYVDHWLSNWTIFNHINAKIIEWWFVKNIGLPFLIFISYSFSLSLYGDCRGSNMAAAYTYIYEAIVKVLVTDKLSLVLKSSLELLLQAFWKNLINTFRNSIQIEQALSENHCTLYIYLLPIIPCENGPILLILHCVFHTNIFKPYTVRFLIESFILSRTVPPVKRAFNNGLPQSSVFASTLCSMFIADLATTIASKFAGKDDMAISIVPKLKSRGTVWATEIDFF